MPASSSGSDSSDSSSDSSRLSDTGMPSATNEADARSEGCISDAENDDEDDHEGDDENLRDEEGAAGDQGGGDNNSDLLEELLEEQRGGLGADDVQMKESDWEIAFIACRRVQKETKKQERVVEYQCIWKNFTRYATWLDETAIRNTAGGPDALDRFLDTKEGKEAMRRDKKAERQRAQRADKQGGASTTKTREEDRGRDAGGKGKGKSRNKKKKKADGGKFRDPGSANLEEEGGILTDLSAVDCQSEFFDDDLALSVVMQPPQGSGGEEYKHHTLLLEKVTELPYQPAYAPNDDLNPRRILNCRPAKVTGEEGDWEEGGGPLEYLVDGGGVGKLAIHDWFSCGRLMRNRQLVIDFHKRTGRPPPQFPSCEKILGHREDSGAKEKVRVPELTDEEVDDILSGRVEDWRPLDLKMVFVVKWKDADKLAISEETPADLLKVAMSSRGEGGMDILFGGGPEEALTAVREYVKRARLPAWTFPPCDSIERIEYRPETAFRGSYQYLLKFTKPQETAEKEEENTASADADAGAESDRYWTAWANVDELDGENASKAYRLHEEKGIPPPVKTRQILRKAEKDSMYLVALNRGSLIAPEEADLPCKWIASDDYPELLPLIRKFHIKHPDTEPPGEVYTMRVAEILKASSSVRHRVLVRWRYTFYDNPPQEKEHLSWEDISSLSGTISSGRLATALERKNVEVPDCVWAFPSEVSHECLSGEESDDQEEKEKAKKKKKSQKKSKKKEKEGGRDFLDKDLPFLAEEASDAESDQLPPIEVVDRQTHAHPDGEGNGKGPTVEYLVVFSDSDSKWMTVEALIDMGHERALKDFHKRQNIPIPSPKVQEILEVQASVDPKETKEKEGNTSKEKAGVIQVSCRKYKVLWAADSLDGRYAGGTEWETAKKILGLDPSAGRLFRRFHRQQVDPNVCPSRDQKPVRILGRQALAGGGEVRGFERYGGGEWKEFEYLVEWEVCSRAEREKEKGNGEGGQELGTGEPVDVDTAATGGKGGRVTYRSWELLFDLLPEAEQIEQFHEEKDFEDPSEALEGAASARQVFYEELLNSGKLSKKAAQQFRSSLGRWASGCLKGAGGGKRKRNEGGEKGVARELPTVFEVLEGGSVIGTSHAGEESELGFGFDEGEGNENEEGRGWNGITDWGGRNRFSLPPRGGDTLPFSALPNKTLPPQQACKRRKKSRLASSTCTPGLYPEDGILILDTRVVKNKREYLVLMRSGSHRDLHGLAEAVDNGDEEVINQAVWNPMSKLRDMVKPLAEFHQMNQIPMTDRVPARISDCRNIVSGKVTEENLSKMHFWVEWNPDYLEEGAKEGIRAGGEWVLLLDLLKEFPEAVKLVEGFISKRGKNEAGQWPPLYRDEEAMEIVDSREQESKPFPPDSQPTTTAAATEEVEYLAMFRLNKVYCFPPPISAEEKAHQEDQQLIVHAWRPGSSLPEHLVRAYTEKPNRLSGFRADLEARQERERQSIQALCGGQGISARGSPKQQGGAAKDFARTRTVADQVAEHLPQFLANCSSLGNVDLAQACVFFAYHVNISESARLKGLSGVSPEEVRTALTTALPMICGSVESVENQQTMENIQRVLDAFPESLSKKNEPRPNREMPRVDNRRTSVCSLESGSRVTSALEPPPFSMPFETSPPPYGFDPRDIRPRDVLQQHGRPGAAPHPPQGFRAPHMRMPGGFPSSLAHGVGPGFPHHPLSEDEGPPVARERQRQRKKDVRGGNAFSFTGEMGGEYADDEGDEESLSLADRFIGPPFGRFGGGRVSMPPMDVGKRQVCMGVAEREGTGGQQRWRSGVSKQEEKAQGKGTQGKDKDRGRTARMPGGGGGERKGKGRPQ
uniref:Chromo domain-containing protein n=1 Tax=Chromera velia CCMP2878 TaxID=1169474 RepID=A0A0G4GCN0_9ALVE|eukprot:Cvel_21178.t1-p1 / transcript=Cvel_21178.t1 / gene=Cvel_21178 / organism=Chromera_velia_CCMP2878 / gene_product=hypothetical protein / transcript_product=hypothetical protein / location=Cvel_scaffold1965:23120-35395(+) / protein_length=1837 / sequence_SO=supercontig / SO=protein_coding / is_pseudo=false